MGLLDVLHAWVCTAVVDRQARYVESAAHTFTACVLKSQIIQSYQTHSQPELPSRLCDNVKFIGKQIQTQYYIEATRVSKN